MTTKKISELTAAGTLTEAEQVPVVQSGSTVRTTIAAILTLARNRANHIGTQEQTSIVGLVADLAAKAADSAVVKLTGDQTIAGVKTFSSPPVVPTATAAGHAINKSQAEALIPTSSSVTGTRPPVKVVSLTNQSIASGAPIIDGYQTVATDRVLLAGQTAPAENGIWVVVASSAWTRPTDFAAGSNQSGGTAVNVAAGTLYKGSEWVLNSTGAVNVGAGAQTWVQDATAVRLTGAQTLAGVKTFSSSPVVPDASWTIAKTSGLQAALDAEGLSGMRVFNVRTDYALTGTGVNNAIAAAQAAGGGVVYIDAECNCDDTIVSLVGKTGVKILSPSQTKGVLRRRIAGSILELDGFHHGILNVGFNGFATPTTASGTTVNASADFTCAALTQAHVGVALSGTGVPPNTFIRAVNGTTGTMTNAATASGTNTLTFAMKGATVAVRVKAYSAATTGYAPVRELDLVNLYIQGCKEGVRFGHYSTLNGVSGDSGDADIAGGNYRNIWIDACDYGWIEDGQNILLSKVANLWTTGITYHHTFQPRGGQVHVDTGYFSYSLAAPATTIAAASNGAALPQATINVASTANFPTVGTIKVTTGAGVQQVAYTGVTSTTFTGCEGGTGTMSTGGAVVSNGFPKCSVGSSNATFIDVRSENATGTQPPVVLTAPGNGTAQVTETRCSWTNSAGVANIDEMMLGGSLVKINCSVDGVVALKNSDYSGVGNDLAGGYLRWGNQATKSEFIMDFVGVGAGPRRISANPGKLRIGYSPTTTAYTPTASLTLGEGADVALALVGPSAPQIGFHIAGQTAIRSAIYCFGSGTTDGLIGIQTRTEGGTLRDALDVYGAVASGETAIAVLCNDSGTYTVKRVTVGAADSGGTGYRALRVPN